MDKQEIKIKNFRDLNIWNLGKMIVNDVYAEGFNRLSNKDYMRFLYISLGSCAELETQIEIAHDQGYIDATNKTCLLEKVDHESRMIRNLIKKLEARYSSPIPLHDKKTC